MITYIIVTKPAILTLQKKVQQFIDTGWLPLGGPFVIPVSHSGIHDRYEYDINVHYGQAMILLPHPPNQEYKQ